MCQGWLKNCREKERTITWTEHMGGSDRVIKGIGAVGRYFGPFLHVVLARKIDRCGILVAAAAIGDGSWGRWWVNWVG